MLVDWRCDHCCRCQLLPLLLLICSRPPMTIGRRRSSFMDDKHRPYRVLRQISLDLLTGAPQLNQIGKQKHPVDWDTRT